MMNLNNKSTQELADFIQLYEGCPSFKIIYAKEQYEEALNIIKERNDKEI